MKKLFLLILFCIPTYAQTYIQTAGDTTVLKLMAQSGPVILLQFGGGTFDYTGGGLFQAIDSAYAEMGGRIGNSGIIGDDLSGYFGLANYIPPILMGALYVHLLPPLCQCLIFFEVLFVINPR